MKKSRFLLVALSMLVSIAFATGSANAAPNNPTSVHVRETPNYSSHLLNAEALDSCSYYQAYKWNDVYNGGPIWGVGFYLGGLTAEAAGCYLATDYWVDNLNNYLRLVPIWDAYQAPCSSYSQRMSSDPDTAYTQGQHAGNNAVAAARAIELNDDIVIYLDMEAYPASCTTTTRRYVGGFVNSLHAHGFVGGVYGSACSPDMDTYATLDNPPDDAWIADYNGTDAASVGSVSCVSTSNWTGGHRIHQWRGGSSATYGGTTLGNVDYNCVYGDTNSAFSDLDTTCSH